MAKEFSRSRRVGEQMQRELALLIQQEVKDPRVRWVTVSGVEVNRDMSFAQVYITLLGHDHNSPETAQALTVLKQVAGYLRRELTRRMRMRHIPELVFRFDESIERGARLSQLIDQAVGKNPKEEE